MAANLGVAVESRRAVSGINNVTKAFKRGRKSAGEFTKGVAGADKSMNKAGTSGMNLKRVLGGVVTGFAAFAVLRSTIRLIADFQRTMAVLGGVANATDMQLKELEKTARNLGKTTQFSAKEAGEGLLFLARAGFTVEESITAIPATLDLAIAGLLDLGEAADIASNVLSQFGLQADQTRRVADVLVKTANSANTDVRQLAEAMKMAGPIAGALGISVEETAASIGVLGNAGIQASLAGTNLRGILAGLLGPTSKAKDAMDRMGTSVEALDPATNSLIEIFEKLKFTSQDVGEATAIFGRRNAAAAIILSQNVDVLKQLEEANRRAAGEAEKQAKIIQDTLAGSFLSLKSAIEEVALSAGDKGLGAALKKIIDVLTSIIREFGRVDFEIQRIVLGWREDIARFTSAIQQMIDTMVEGIKTFILLDKQRLQKTGTGIMSFVSGLFGGPTFQVGAESELAKKTKENIADLKSTLADIAAARKTLAEEQIAAGFGPKISKPLVGGDSDVPGVTPGMTASEIARRVKAFEEGPRTAVVSDREAELEEEAIMRVQRRNEELRTTSQTIKELISAEDLRRRGLSMTANEREVLIARTDAQRIVEAEAAAIAEKAGLTEQDRARYIKELVDGKKEQIDQLTEEIIKRQKLEEQMKRATQLGRSVGNVMARSLENILLSMDKIIDKTFDWQSALRAVARDLTRIAIRQFVTQPLADVIGKFAGTQLMPSSVTSAGTATELKELPSGIVVRAGGLAAGGIIDRPMMTLAGEAGPEAILPLRRGSDGKLGVTSEGDVGGQRPIVMHFHGVTDMAGFRRSKPQMAAFFRRALSK